jgi:hypothetical protein
MNKLLIFSIILLTFSICKAQGQMKIEYGKPAELKGLTKIFVDTEGDTEERERIFKQFEKDGLKDITLLDSADGAEIILLFKGGKFEKTEGYVVNGNGDMDTKLRSKGKGIAYLPKSANTMRVILSVEDTKENALDKKPSIKFAREFIKVYKEANGLK